MEKYTKRVIESNECDSFDEVAGLIQECSDRICDLSTRLAALEAETGALVNEDGKKKKRV